MWQQRFLPPGSSLRRRVYADGKPRVVTDLWQRWGWLGYWALAGVFALGMVGVLCLALARGRVLQAVGMLLVLAPVALLLLAALAATVAIAVALLSPRDRARGEE